MLGKLFRGICASNLQTLRRPINLPRQSLLLSSHSNATRFNRTFTTVPSALRFPKSTGPSDESPIRRRLVNRRLGTEHQKHVKYSKREEERWQRAMLGAFLRNKRQQRLEFDALLFRNQRKMPVERSNTAIQAQIRALWRRLHQLERQLKLRIEALPFWERCLVHIDTFIKR